ncbi:MAG TPA: holo-ACP synthase [Gemmatimonadaceae bacterium]|nr:holo-ACP synthase [Gemmatimonadaceae bacterium]
MVIGLGIDVVDIPRARRMLDAHGDRLLGRVCTAQEISYIKSHLDGSRHLAVRLAAKEAAFKALAGSLEARAISWREIEVVSADGGPPSLTLHGRAFTRMQDIRGVDARLSLTHSDAVAVAIVLIQDSRAE